MHKVILVENLSPRVAVSLRAAGVDVIHVRDRGMCWRPLTPMVLERAFSEDRVLFTCNVEDFRKLARGCEVHAGMVMLPGGLLREEQRELIESALKAMCTEADMVNRVLTVALDGSVTAEDLPEEDE